MHTQMEIEGLRSEFSELSVSGKAIVEEAQRTRARKGAVGEQGESLFEIQGADPKGGKITIVANPLLVMAYQLRGELHKFLHASLNDNRQASIGFEGAGKRVVNPAGLASNVEQMCQKLEDYFHADYRGSQGLNFKVGVHNLQTQLEHFLILLSGMELQRDPVSSARREILTAAVQLKISLAEMVIQAQAEALPVNPDDNPQTAA